MHALSQRNYLPHLYYLLEYLAAWEKRPACLTPMAYQWCIAISKMAGGSGHGGVPIIQPRPLWHQLGHRLESQLGHELEFQPKPLLGLGLRLRLGLGLQQPDLVIGEGLESLSSIIEGEFSEVGPGCDSAHSDGISNHTQGDLLGDLISHNYAYLLSITLEIGFRLAAPCFNQPTFHSNHIPHPNWMFETAFSSLDDEVIADAVCAWVAGGNYTSPSLCAHYFAKRIERDMPFSPRLRQVSICAIEHIWRSELEVSGLETIHLLNHLKVDVDDLETKDGWQWLLVGVIRSPVGLGSLSSHYWHLLDKLERVYMESASCDVEVMRSLVESEEWEKLEIWMTVMWASLGWFSIQMSMSKHIEEVILKLFLQRPSAIARFEDLCQISQVSYFGAVELQQICNKAHAKQLPLESPLLL